MFTHQNPAVQNPTPSFVAAPPWKMDSVQHNDFMMVPGTVSKRKLEMVTEVKQERLIRSYGWTSSARSGLLWTRAAVSLAVTIRGGPPDTMNYIALVKLDIDDPEGDLEDLGRARIAPQAVDPSLIWMTLIYNVNQTPINPDGYFKEIQQVYQTIPDANKAVIIGEQKAAAIHFDGYVGELTPVQVSSLESSDFKVKNYDVELKLLYPNLKYY